MLNCLKLYGAALLLLALAAPAAAQNRVSDYDLLERQRSGQLTSEDRRRLGELEEDDANSRAAAVADGELRQKLLRLPPLPVEQNVLLGSWRQEGGGQKGAILGSGASTGGDMISELAEALLSNPEKLLPSRCVSNFGYGVTFAPSTFSIRAFDGSTPGGSIAYRSGGKQGIWIIPDSILKIMPFKIAGPDRILLGIDGSCALVRDGAPAVDAGPTPTTAPGNARAAVAGSSLPPAGNATRAAAAGPARKPIEPSSRLGRGVQLHGEKDFQPALQQFLAAAQSDPNDPRVYVYLADTYGWLGMEKEAKQAAERAKQLDPNAFEILR